MLSFQKNMHFEVPEHQNLLIKCGYFLVLVVVLESVKNMFKRPKYMRDRLFWIIKNLPSFWWAMSVCFYSFIVHLTTPGCRPLRAASSQIRVSRCTFPNNNDHVDIKQSISSESRRAVQSDPLDWFKLKWCSKRYKIV